MAFRGLYYYIFFIFSLVTMSMDASAIVCAENDEGTRESDQMVSRFFRIDTQEYDLNQRFCTELFTGMHSPNGYKVEIRYPEFQELTSKERKALNKSLDSGQTAPCGEADSESDDRNGVEVFPCTTPVVGLHLQHYVSVGQKKDYVNVSFSPIVFHENRWKRIASCQIRISPNTSLARRLPEKEPSARWAENSVLARGKWCKVRVENEGIYQLDSESAKKMGFDDLKKVRIYGYGGLLQDETFTFPAYDPNTLQNMVPDDLAEIPVLETNDGRLLCWMEGTQRLIREGITNRFSHKQNHYSRYSYYFITESDESRLTPAPLKSEAVGTKVVDAIPYVSIVDPDNFNWYSGGRKMFDSFDFQTSNSHSYRVLTPDCTNDESTKATATISLSAASNLAASNFDISINGTKIGNLTVEKIKADTDFATIATKLFTVPVALSATEGNVVQMTKSGGNSARLDYIRINYTRHLTATSTPYSFSILEKSPVTLHIANASSNTHLWRLGQNGVAHEEVETTVNDGMLIAQVSTPQRRFVFFDDSKTYPAPEFVGHIENQNLHAHHDVDYVIIVPASGKLMEQAERLGKIHAAHDGISYQVVRADQLYNEFSSGTPDANAYRRYLKMLYDRASTASASIPRYCLLMGKSPWDNRFKSEYWSQKIKNIDDYLLAYEADNSQDAVGSVNSYVSDDFFGLLDDGEGANITREKLDVALGRMVCFTDEEAALLVDKVELYISNQDAGNWKNTIAVLADDGDDNSHMKDGEAVAASIEQVAPDLNINKIYWDRYKWKADATGYTYPQATASIIKQMTDGALLFNYSGHGSPILISHEKVLQTSDFQKAYSPYMPLWVLASCEIYPFDNEETNLAEVSLYVKNGGSIGFVCATRSVYASYNNAFNRAYCMHVLSKDEQGHLNTMGEALRLAKNDIVDNRSDLTINKLKYVLFGDPALCLALPTGVVKLDSINGQPIKDNQPLINLPAGSVVQFAGHVCSSDGDSCDTQFEGAVTATIYDAATDITCQNNQKSSSGSYVFNERQRIVYKGSTNAIGGKFKFNVVIPRDISYSSASSRISFYALSNDKQQEYKGMSESFCMNGTADGEMDNEPPKVIAYINSTDNPDYVFTDSNPVLIADIYDESGINTSGLSLGHDIELVLDGNNAESVSLNDCFTYDFDSYQKGQVVYQLLNVTPGMHTATIRVWDIYNNFSTADVHFIVNTREAKIGKHGSVTASQNPAYTNTRLIAYHPADSSECESTTFEVYDQRGRLVAGMDAPETHRGCSILNWNLQAANGGVLNAGVYFYRAVFHTSSGTHTTDAQKLIIVQ